MTEARDLAWIGIPFAAGAAAGAILFSGAQASPILLPAVLGWVICILTIVSFLRLGNSSDRNLIRLVFGSIFIIAGLFCSLNSVLCERIPLPGGPLARLSSSCSALLTGRIDAIPFPSPGTGPLVKALLTGERSGLDRATVEMFRSSGASHLLALSGLHLGVIYLILTRLTSPLGNSPAAKKARYLLVVGASGFYALMTASASITRAFLFILIGETGKLSGRERNPSRVLLGALTLQLAMKPEVISTAGFQLSYLAMLGICLLYPPLDGLYPRGEGIWSRVDPFRKIWSAAVLSISCQAFTAPLVWYRFHSFPEYFLITNLIALPLTSAVMVLSVTTIALSFLGICPDVLVLLDDKAVGLLTGCLGIIGSL